jgi:peroxiredoxin family protein
VSGVAAAAEQQVAASCDAPGVAPEGAQPATIDATYVLFSGDLDKQLMAFTLANAAAASGLTTQVFFAFWGVSAMRQRRCARGKSLMERAFGWLVPCGSKALPMSRLNFLGLGGPLIRWRMRKLGMVSLEQQIDMAEALGVQFVVCAASMQMMGFREEELRDSIRIGGAAACLGSAIDSKVAMVI